MAQYERVRTSTPVPQDASGNFEWYAGSNPAGYRSPCGQVIWQGFLVQQPTKYLVLECQKIVEVT